MEFVILGLLLLRNMSQYDIRNVLQQKISPFYSASLGSIQAALKKLERNGHIACHDVVENGRRKKLYAVNSLGKQHFMDWMLSPIIPSRLEQDAPTRLFFLGFMTQAERLSIMNEVIALLEATIQQYEAAFIEAKQKAVPEHFNEIAVYQFKTLELGLFYHQRMLEWFGRLAKELEAERNG